MRLGWIASLVALIAMAGSAHAQFPSASENLLITAAKASTWDSAGTRIIQLEGPVTIVSQRTTMSSKRAVVWLAAPKGVLLDEQHAEIALLGDATLEQPNSISRSGDRLFVDLTIRGAVRITADQRTPEDLSTSDLYRAASALRPGAMQSAQDRKQAATWLLQQPWMGAPASRPSTAPSTRQFRPAQPVTFTADQMQTTTTRDGTVAVILTGHVALLSRTASGDLIELQAQRAVVFTPLHNLRELEKAGNFTEIEDAVVGVYLEDDVRMQQTPAQGNQPDQRLLANRVYYDTTTDRAVLTDAVLHTFDFKKKLPIVIRAQEMRQLSAGEYQTDHARLTTSLFATPSYSIGASSLYVRQVQTGHELAGTETLFSGRNLTFNIGSVPVFWLPAASGVMDERGPIRHISTGQSSQDGTYITGTFGVYETLGLVPPKDFDFSYTTAYYSKRGPMFGVDGRYIGGFIGEASRQPWTYSGDFTGATLWDQGEDDMGKGRSNITSPTPWRGRFWWEHQHFLSSEWQVQLTAGYVSDPTYAEYWYRDQFNESLPRESALYVRRQDQSEVFSFLLTLQPNNFPTASESVQEQAEIERIPELGYHRVGDSVWNDSATLFSDNTLSALRFQSSHASLAQQGYALRSDHFRQSPGIPSYGFTGTPSEVIYRGDFREELTFPFGIEQYRAVPYIVGRYTAYTDSPDARGVNRFYGGAGLRLTTAFWKIDDSVESSLLDLHRLRHVIEPELHVFYGVQTADRDDVFVYDESIDNAHDLGAVQFALHQRWQTKRGGAGRWRNVDVFTLNVEGNYFFRRPPRSERDPVDFRGLFFASLPEASIPRNSINGDFAWLLSDVVTIQGDAQYNADEWKLATGSVGFTIQHDPRLTWGANFRYIGLDFAQIVNGAELLFIEQKLLTIWANYQFTSRYTLAFSESYDLGKQGNVKSTLTLTRQFDRFFVAVSMRIDNLGHDNVFGFNVYPEGFLQKGTSRLQGALGP